MGINLKTNTSFKGITLQNVKQCKHIYKKCGFSNPKIRSLLPDNKSAINLYGAPDPYHTGVATDGARVDVKIDIMGKLKESARLIKGEKETIKDSVVEDIAEHTKTTKGFLESIFDWIDDNF